MDAPTRKAKGTKTQWTAQFLVAAELIRRVYTVASTMGNYTPIAGLMVRAPSGKQFWVDVKGLASKSAWLLRPKDASPDLYYIVVYLAPAADSPNVRQEDEFFVLTQVQANALVQDYAKRHPGDRGAMPGFGFNDLQHAIDSRHKLPW